MLNKTFSLLAARLIIMFAALLGLVQIGYAALPDSVHQSISPPKMTLIGGPTVILEIGGLRLMTDPTFDPAGTTFEIRGKNVVQKLEGPILKDPGKVDIVLLSHDQHPDNLDSSGRAWLINAGKVLTTKDGAVRLKGNAIGLSTWQTLQFKSPEGDDINITAVPARHGPYGTEKISGKVTGFLIDVKGRNHYEIYISGDTEYFSGIDEIAKKFHPDYALVFAGAAQPAGPIKVTMDSNDLIEVARVFPKALVIPVHCEGWSHYLQHPADYLKAFTIFGLAERLRVLKPGVTTEFNLRSTR